MGKYSPLETYLREAPTEEPITLTFDAIEALVGPLPPSSSQRAWWSNTWGHPQSAAWLAAGRSLDNVDPAARVVEYTPVGEIPTKKAGTMKDRPVSSTPVILDGVGALEAVVLRAGYPSTMHAVAAHTYFLHPETVAQTHGQALFPIVRSMAKRGSFGELPSIPPRRVYFDDNRTPTDVFLWSAQRKRGPDVQYNHVWTRAGDPAVYTALWNLCATPAFLAKTTDGKNHSEVTRALRRRSFDLFGHLPSGESPPEAPPRFDELRWPAPPPPVEGLEAVLRARLIAAPKSPAAVVARELGWLFSGFEPDPKLLANLSEASPLRT